MRARNGMAALLGTILVGMLFLVGCGGAGTDSGGGNQGTTPASVSLLVDRTEISIGETLEVKVEVAGSSNPVVKWEVDEVENGNAKVGTIMGSGATFTYVAPATEGEHVLAATSILDASKSASLSIRIRKGTNPATVTLSPAGTTVAAGATVAYSAAVSGTASQTLTWFVDNIRDGNATVGNLTSNGDSAHVRYTAPDAGGSHAIKAVATNAQGATSIGSTTVTVQGAVMPPPAIQGFSASPATITAGQGSILSWSASGATQLTVAPTVGDVTSLSSKNVNPATTTTYTLTARNASGQTASATTKVTVSAVPVAPAITSQPLSKSVTEGQTASFTVSATSASAMSYQWRKNGAAISGATSSSYTTPATVIANSGATFTVVVSNATGSVTSSEAILIVNSSQKQYYGFGSKATGGAGHPTVHVTNLSSSGAGSLREAISGSNRTIVFDVGGTIAVPEALTITGANITIDGSTAPAPGITLSGHSLRLMNGANNIILTSFRHRGGWDGSGSGGGDPDNISIMVGCHNIVIDHLSLSNSYDENLGIWDGNYDITVQNCILGDGNAGGERYGMLISNGNLRVSVYHNIFHNAYYRQPAVGWDTSGVAVAPSLVAEVVNNLVWDYPTRGTTVYWGGKANVIGNYYFSSLRPGESNRAVNTESQGVSYATGNYSKDGSSVSGSTSTPFAVAAYAQLAATSAANAATFVMANAGCRTGGLDAVDVSILGDLVP